MVLDTSNNQNKFCRIILLLILFVLIRCTPSYSQSKVDSLLTKLDPQKLAASISKSTDKLQQKILKKSEKVLTSMQRQEEKIYKKMLDGKDSLLAKAKLNEVKEKYASMKSGLRAPAIANKVKQFIPRLDSLNTSLKFLQESGMGGKVKDALAKTASLQDKFQQAEEVKKFIKDRREQLKQQLGKLGVVKQLKQINKQVYYYAAQVREYKEILNDPKKIERKAMELLSKTKPWKDFFKKNSLLASMFRIPEDNMNSSVATSLTGLQARVQVNQLIQQQISVGGQNVQQQFEQNIQNGQAQLQVLKDKISQFGQNNGDGEMPDFKPNNQKTKPFLKRLEYGGNIQTQKASNYFPAASDIGFSIGYKINDKSIIGVGGSYKIGLGNGWRDIRFSSQGIGIRSFIDWKIKGSFYLSGGYEQNYRSTFDNYSELRDLSKWQQSGLLGLSRKYKVSKKINGKAQLLWDFMSYQQVPRTQPVIFRIGFSKK